MDDTLLEQAIATLERANAATTSERYLLIEEALRLFRLARDTNAYPPIPDQLTPEASQDPEEEEPGGEPSPP